MSGEREATHRIASHRMQALSGAAAEGVGESPRQTGHAPIPQKTDPPTQEMCLTSAKYGLHDTPDTPHLPAPRRR